MITENLSTLKINKLTQSQYDRELAAGNIEENALYLTPDEGGNNGLTPFINDAGNWQIGEEDTGVAAQGEKGDAGYTPIKSVDYWTPEDKQEIVNSVIDALPKYNGEVENI